MNEKPNESNSSSCSLENQDEILISNRIEEIIYRFFHIEEYHEVSKNY